MTKGEYPKAVLAASFFVAIAAFVYAVQLIYIPLILPIIEVATPFVIAIILAYLLDPIVSFIQRKGMSRGFGVAIVGLSFLIVFLLIGFLIVPRIADQAVNLARNFREYVNQAQSQVNGLLESHKTLLEKMHLPTTAADLAKQFADQTKEATARSLGFVAAALSSVLSRILWIVIIPMTTLWVLRDLEYIKAKIIHLLPQAHKSRVVELAGAIGGVFAQYIRGMLAVALIFSIVAALVLTGFKLQYGLVIGAFAGLLYMVPYVGVAILAITTGIVALVQPPHSFAYAAILMGILIVQSFVVFDLFVTPKIVGRSVGVHPVISLFALALGARLFGVVGMVAAVPVAASLQVALGQIYPKIKDKAELSSEKSQEA